MMRDKTSLAFNLPSAAPGQAYVEYLLIGGLLSVAVFGAMLMNGDALNGLLESVFGKMQNHAAVASSAHANRPAPGDPILPTPPPSAVPTVNGPGAVLPPPTPAQQRVCFDGGWCLNVPKLASSGAGAETAGGLGGDFVVTYADSLDQIVAQLEAAGEEVDPELRDIVTRLANQGHTIADAHHHAEAYLKTPLLEDYTNAKADYNNAYRVQYDVVNDVETFFLIKTELNTYLAHKNPNGLPAPFKQIIENGTDTVDALSAVVLEQVDIRSAKAHNNTLGCMKEGEGGFGCLPGAFSRVGSVPLTTAKTEATSNGICGAGGKRRECMRAIYNTEPSPVALIAPPSDYDSESGMAYFGGGMPSSAPSYMQFTHGARMHNDALSKVGG